MRFDAERALLDAGWVESGQWWIPPSGRIVCHTVSGALAAAFGRDYARDVHDGRGPLAAYVSEPGQDA